MSMLNESSFDSTVNETSPDSKVEVNVAYAVAVPIVSILTVIGNLGTINAFRKLPELWEKPSEMLILSLSCADLITGLIVLPSRAPTWITPGYWPYGENFCRFTVFCETITVIAGLHNLIAISFDRFLLVFKEYPQYMKIQTERRIYTYIAVIWLWPVTLGIIDTLVVWDIKKQDESTTIDFTRHCESPAVGTASGIPHLVTLGIPLTSVGGFCAAFFYLLNKRLKKSWDMRAESQFGNQLATVSSSVDQTSTPRAMSSDQRKQYIKPAVVLSVLVSAMATCTLPRCIYVLVEVMCPQCSSQQEIDYFLLSSFLLFCNSMLDPFLYAMTQRKILRFYKQLFTK